MNRPRLSLPTGLPPEIWAVMALLATAGLFTGVPVLRALPDAIKLLSDGGVWDSIGPLVLVLLVELGLLAAACIVLAWLLSQGDPVARVITIVVSGSLAFGLLVGDVLDGTSAIVTLVASVAALVCLLVPPRAREFFATRGRPGDVPSSVVAAEAIVVMLSALLLAAGVAYLPLTSVAAKFAVVGLVLIGIAVAGFRLRKRLQAADVAARTLISGLMAGDVVAVVVGGEGAFTGPLLILLAVAVAVVVLLWIPQESQAFFGSGPPLRLPTAAGGGRPSPPERPQRPQRPQVSRSTEYDDFADYAPPPLPAGASDFDPSLRSSGFDPPPAPSRSSDFAPPPLPPPPRSPESAPPRPSTPVPPPPRSPEFAPPRPSDLVPPPAPPGHPAPPSRRPPMAPRQPQPSPPSAARAASPATPAAHPPPPPPAAPAPVPSPPAWLLAAPPPGFWPTGRRRAAPRQYEMVDVPPRSSDGHHVAPALGLRFDTTSWFPTLDGREQVRGAYLVSMVMFDDTGVTTAFRGTSTLIVTSSRLLGVCPRGESPTGPLDAAAGRVAAWTILLDQLDWVQAEGAADGGHLSLKGWDSEGPWALLARARVATDGAFQPVGLTDLADLVNRAKHSSA